MDQSLLNPQTSQEWFELFIKACRIGNLDRVQHLCAAPFKPIANIHGSGEYGLEVACERSYLDIVKFLTTSKDLLEAGHTFANIHTQNDEGFRLACENSQWNVIQFLIFDLNLEKNETIKNIIQDYPQVRSYFKARKSGNSNMRRTLMFLFEFGHASIIQ